MEYYTKVKKCGKLAGYNENQLKYQFLHGLSPDNQLEARRCGTDLSLDELVAKLSVIENNRKINDICPYQNNFAGDFFSFEVLIQEVNISAVYCHDF